MAAAFGEGLVEEKLVAAVEEIEDDENGGDVAAHFGGNALAAEALLERGEGQGAGSAAGVPCEDFAVEDGGFGDGWTKASTRSGKAAERSSRLRE